MRPGGTFFGFSTFLPALFMKLLLQSRIRGCDGQSRRSALRHTAQVCLRASRLRVPVSLRVCALSRRTFMNKVGLLLASLLLVTVGPAWAVPMKDDPNGFEGIPWGAAFSETDTFSKVEDADRIQSYELKGPPPTLGSVPVDSMRFSTIDGKFARVTIRYHGKETHDGLLAFLQSRYGPLDRTPGQIASGAVKFFAWQGSETEIALRYEARTDQGIIFFESYTLRQNFTEGNSPTVY